MKYYGSSYGVGSTKYGRKIISVSGSFDRHDLAVGIAIGKSESIICGVYDYGLTFGIFGLYVCIGWFIAECGVWQESDLTEK
jgi:hypothetical protein